MSVAGKVVAITGTSNGIGRTIAEVFAERGALVYGCARSTDKGLKVQERIREAGGSFTFVTTDVTNQDQCFAFIDAVVAEQGRIDVLINNAGGNEKWVLAEDVSPEYFDSVVQLNLNGPLYCSQRAIHHMKAQDAGGVLLHIASSQGVLAAAGGAAYNAAKAGLIQLSRTLAVEMLEHDVRSNVIVMGGAPTRAAGQAVREMTKAIHGPDAEPDFTQYLPKPLTGTPLRDIGTALAALASDDSRAITGATIAIDQAQTAGSLFSDAMLHALSGGWARGVA